MTSKKKSRRLVPPHLSLITSAACHTGHRSFLCANWSRAIQACRRNARPASAATIQCSRAISRAIRSSPGVILTEALAQTAGMAAAAAHGEKARPFFLLSAIRTMKFLHPVRPDERIVLRARKLAEIDDLLQFQSGSAGQWEASRGGRTCADRGVGRATELNFYRGGEDCGACSRS